MRPSLKAVPLFPGLYVKRQCLRHKVFNHKKHKYVFQNDAVRHNIFNYKYQRQQFLELWWKYKSIVTWTSQRLVTDKNLETNFKIPLRKNLEKRNLLLLSAVGDTKLRFMKLSGLIGSTERPGNWTFNLQEKPLLIICLRCEKEYLATDFVCWPLSTHRLDPLSTISHPSRSPSLHPILPPFPLIIFTFTFLFTLLYCYFYFYFYFSLYFISIFYFYRTQIYLGSDLWVRLSLTHSLTHCTFLKY